MYCHPSFRYARLESVPDRVGSLEIRQKRRVDVDDFIFVSVDEIRRKNSHETGQSDQVDLLAFQDFHDEFFVTGAVGKKFRAYNHERDAVFLRAADRVGLGVVAHHQREIRFQFFLPDRVDDRLKIRPVAGAKDC